MLRTCLLLALVLVATRAPAQDEPPSTLPAMEEEAALRSAERRGMLVYRHDRAAAIATDELSRLRGFKRNKQLGGWISQAQGDDIVVTFIGRDELSQSAFYRVRLDSDLGVVGDAEGYTVPAPLTPFEAAASKARTTALRGAIQPCAESYNAVVLPEGDDLEKWAVYLLPATTKKTIVPMGGSYRVAVDNARGDAVVRPYTRTCIQLQNDPKAVGLMVTHLLDPVPTDVHVFWSLWAGKSMYVVTPPKGTVWAIEAASIRLVQRRE